MARDICFSRQMNHPGAGHAWPTEACLRDHPYPAAAGARAGRSCGPWPDESSPDILEDPELIERNARDMVSDRSVRRDGSGLLLAHSGAVLRPDSCSVIFAGQLGAYRDEIKRLIVSAVTAEQRHWLPGLSVAAQSTVRLPRPRPALPAIAFMPDPRTPVRIGYGRSTNDIDAESNPSTDGRRGPQLRFDGARGGGFDPWCTCQTVTEWAAPRRTRIARTFTTVASGGRRNPGQPGMPRHPARAPRGACRTRHLNCAPRQQTGVDCATNHPCRTWPATCSIGLAWLLKINSDRAVACTVKSRYSRAGAAL